MLQDPMSALDPVKTIGSQIVEAIAVHEPELRRSAARKRAAELLREVDIARRTAASTTIPTSIRAACASVWRSRSRSPTTRAC